MGLKKLLKKYNIPTFFLVSFLLCVLSAIIHIVSRISYSFADFFNEKIANIFRIILAKLTNFLPISFAEILIILSPAILFLLIFFGIKYSKTKIKAIRFICCLFSVLLLFYTVFVFTLATGYNNSSIAEKVGIEREDISTSDLKNTALILNEKMKLILDDIEFKEESSSVANMTVREMSDEINKSYASLSEIYDFLPNFTSNIKPIMLSKPLTYTHITGVYSFFTGEANVNTNEPDYTVAFSIAHELAHQRGIAREDEANFMAFLVCINSENKYIQYAGYMNIYEYITNSLYEANEDEYISVLKSTDSRILYEMYAFAEFFEEYRDSTASKISGTINDVYLKSNNTEGTKSYGLVSDLVVAYYKENK